MAALPASELRDIKELFGKVKLLHQEKIQTSLCEEFESYISDVRQANFQKI